MKPVSANIHGALDYITAAALFTCPYFFLKHGSAAAEFSFAVSILQFLLAMCTRYPLGIVKWLPFRTHGYIEAGVAIIFGLVGLGFLSQHAPHAFFYYEALMLIYFTVFFLTDFNVRSQDKKFRNHNRP